MTKAKNVAIVGIVVVAAAAAVVLKQTKKTAPETPDAAHVVAPASKTQGESEPGRAAQGEKLPRLVDLGAHSCVPCKMMAPILEELKKEYAGVFKTEFIDVWQNQEPARRYGIRVIPTQIFFDAEGKELFRHEGYFGKEDILQTWRKHGIAVSTK